MAKARRDQKRIIWTRFLPSSPSPSSSPPCPPSSPSPPVHVVAASPIASASIVAKSTSMAYASEGTSTITRRVHVHVPLHTAARLLSPTARGEQVAVTRGEEEEEEGGEMSQGEEGEADNAGGWVAAVVLQGSVAAGADTPSLKRSSAAFAEAGSANAAAAVVAYAT